MKHYKNFYFEKFEFDLKTLQATFYYSFDDELFFREKIFFFDSSFALRKDINLDIVNNLLFSIHIALGVSYYKFYPVKNLILKTGEIDDFAKDFWRKFYLNGLGEFFYKNDIDPNGLVNFSSQSSKKFSKIDFDLSERYLVPIGGGKDSIVSIELLKRLGKKIDLVTFASTDNWLYKATEVNSSLKRIFIKRELSENIQEVIKLSYFNGHVPITGIISFVLGLVCYLYDYKYIVLSNERSANFENTTWKGIKINHQRSKSFQFEKDFSSYTKKYISSNIKYFSLLRPFYELKVAQIFSKVGEKYFSSFSSCNSNFKIFKKDLSIELKKKHWCASCPKCAFAYAILRAYLDKDQILSIFGKDFYEDEKLEKLFRELFGISGIKPFECVGTDEEVILAAKIACDNRKGNLPFILRIFENEIKSKMDGRDFDRLNKKILTPNYRENMIPKKLLKELKNMEI